MDKHSENFFKEASSILENMILNAIPLRTYWKDAELNYMGCNEAFAKDAGLKSVDEIIGKSDFELGWKEKAELLRLHDREVIDSKRSRLYCDESFYTPEGESSGIVHIKCLLLRSLEK